MELWHQLSATTQDALLLGASLGLPLLIFTVVVLRYRLLPVALTLLTHHRTSGIAMILLISLATGINFIISVQARALVNGTARAADPFDLLIVAPGNDIDALLSIVYLQPSAMQLLDAGIVKQVQADPAVEFSAPVSFGDSVQRYPLIGTSDAMLRHLTGVNDSFKTDWALFAGANTNLKTGSVVYANHGFSDSDESTSHTAQGFHVVKKLPITGTQWDRAAIVPITALWQLHGLGEHSFEAMLDESPGVPGLVVKAKSYGELYSLRQKYNTEKSMAFFPAEVLARLYDVFGTFTGVIRSVSLFTQLLVICSVLLGSTILMRSLSDRFATMHALGAPATYRFLLIWLYVALLIVTGLIAGCFLGWIASELLSHRMSLMFNLPVVPELELSDFHGSVILINLALLLSLFPAYLLTQGTRIESETTAH